MHEAGHRDGAHAPRNGGHQAGHGPHTGMTVPGHLVPGHPVETHVNDDRARLDDVLVQEAGHSRGRYDQV